MERFPTEDLAPSLVWAVLLHQSKAWRSVEVRQGQVIHTEEALRSMPKQMLAVNNICDDKDLAA